MSWISLDRVDFLTLCESRGSYVCCRERWGLAFRDGSTSIGVFDSDDSDGSKLDVSCLLYLACNDCPIIYAMLISRRALCVLYRVREGNTYGDGRV